MNSNKRQLPGLLNHFSADFDYANKTTVAPPKMNGFLADAPVIGLTKFQPVRRWGASDSIILLGVGIFSVMALTQLINMALDAGLTNILPALTVFAQIAGIYGVWLAGMVFVSKKYGQRSFLKDFGLEIHPRDLLYGVVFGLFALWLQVTIHDFITPLSPVMATVKTDAGYGLVYPEWHTILFTIVIPLTFAPLFEELFYRGFLLGGIVRSFAAVRSNFVWGWLWHLRYTVAVFISALAFGLAHGQSYSTPTEWLTIIQAGVIGLVLGVMAVVFKRLGPSIIAHMVNNILVVSSMSALFTG
jgi:uncharacterized protein